jgi:hypothetical protein
MVASKKALVIFGSITVLFSAFLFFVTPPVHAHHHPIHEGTSCKSKVLGIPTWHEYLEYDESCGIKTPNGLLAGNIPWLIAAAVLEILLRIAVYVAIVFVFMGGYQIIASGANPEGINQGRSKIINAIVGMIIAITATSIVSFLVTDLTANAGSVAGLPDVTADGGRSVINKILSLAYRIAAGLSVIFIAIAGIQFSASGGDPQRVNKARNNIIWAVIGLAVLLSSVTIIAFIGGEL